MSRFDTLCCTDRDPLALSLIRLCGDENLMSITPGRKEARTPQNLPLQHVTWQTTASHECHFLLVSRPWEDRLRGSPWRTERDKNDPRGFRAYDGPLQMVNRPLTTLSFASLFLTPFSYPGYRDLSQRPLVSPFILLNTTTPSHQPFVLVFLYFSDHPPSIKPAGALDGNDHHDSDQGCFELTSKDCAWTLIFATDDEPDASGYSEYFAFASTFDLTQACKPGERTAFWYGYAESEKQREQHESEQRL